jgi:hypothetical protein
MSSVRNWRPIAEAQFIPDHTVADLKMKSGRVYRATWEFRGRCCAWWLAPGQNRFEPIGLYEPVGFIVVAEGVQPAPSNRPV